MKICETTKCTRCTACHNIGTQKCIIMLENEEDAVAHNVDKK